MSLSFKGVGEGGGGGQGGGGARASPLSKVGGAQVGLCPPPLLGIANILISLFAYILWLKYNFFKIFLARFARQL